MQPTLFDSNNDRFPVISMWQPWAQWVIFGWKTIETRTHQRFASLARRRIGIHAAQKWDDDALILSEKYFTHEMREKSLYMNKSDGMLIGTAFVGSHRLLNADDSEKAMIDCGNTQRWGMILTDIKVIDPIPMKGRQGIWYASRGIGA